MVHPTAPDTATARLAADPLFNQSLEKGLDVLRAFTAAHRTLTLSELAQLTGMTKGSAQRTVHTLQVLGYVGKHPQTRRFQLLPKVIEIGFNYLAAHPLIRVAHPYLSQLATASGETASLTEPVGTDMVFVAQLLTTQFIPVLTPVGMRIPMYCTSSGRAYLSQLPEAEARAHSITMGASFCCTCSSVQRLVGGDRCTAATGWPLLLRMGAPTPMSPRNSSSQLVA